MSFQKILASLILSCLIPLANAHEFDVGALHIDHPWARALPPVAETGAAYLTIINRGEQADTLLAATTPVADKVEIHEHLHEQGLMKMQQVEEVSIAPGARLAFQPGEYHLMLFNLKQPLNAGSEFPLTLRFAEAGAVEVMVKVQAEEPADATDDPHSHH
ncbi:MAG: copper chaperone PCu(A)C [Halopseudomonas sp.]|uniref:copper chaperone PCu(A)C n=1 Tax=Halopseudomonas sp. TaxID=2901191 RepID=UPI003001922B